MINDLMLLGIKSVIPKFYVVSGCSNIFQIIDINSKFEAQMRRCIIVSDRMIPWILPKLEF